MKGVSLKVVAILGIFLAFHARAMASSAPSWTLWTQFKHQFLQSDGRIIDRFSQDRTTSEGEAYTLFFALVAGDRGTFRSVLSWTENNLARGDLSRHLPAWLWGRRPDRRWGVLDANSASDADCWIAYSLIEAGRLWKEPAYSQKGLALLFRIERNEIRFLPGFGWALLPGPFGFRLANGTTRLNPSYFPLELLTFFSILRPHMPWRAIKDSYLTHLSTIDAGDFAPDWFAVTETGRVVQDPVRGPIGSYDAIRVYLWAGLLPEQDSEKALLLRHLLGMGRYLDHHPDPPLYVDPLAGFKAGDGPPGFSNALLPYLHSLNLARPAGHTHSSDRPDQAGTGTHPPPYYDMVLSLFGEGFVEHRFSFSPKGGLLFPGRHPSPS